MAMTIVHVCHFNCGFFWDYFCENVSNVRKYDWKFITFFDYELVNDSNEKLFAYLRAYFKIFLQQSIAITNCPQMTNVYKCPFLAKIAP